MKHIRKYIALTLCLTLLCGLLACAKSDNKQADASGSVTLKVGASITPHAEILREAAKILEKTLKNQLLVVDDKGHLIGALHMHDLMSAKVI